MITIKSVSDQTLSKDDFIVKGDYFRSVKFLGITLWKINSKIDNEISKDDFKKKKDNVGFGSK